MPKISIIIPTYNREKYVTKAINSVMTQTYKDYEIIVVDDGSTDNTKAKLKRFGNDIKYFYQSNCGVSAARNMGIEIAKGEWLAFLDSDDEWMPEYLSTQIEKLNQNPRVCMQTANCFITELDGQKKSYFEINGSLAKFNGADYILFEKPFCLIIQHGPWPMPSTIIRREAIIKAGLFDMNLSLSEDFDLIARVSLQGLFGMIRQELVNAYHRNESTECLTNQSKKDPIGAREVNERIFGKLKKIEMINYKERKALKKIISANRRAIGNILIKEGKIKEARDYYRRAIFIDTSVASLGRYILSFIPKNIMITIK